MASPILAVIDTNVIVSALLTANPNSPTTLVVTKIFEGIIKPVVNDEILEEYLEVLKRPKFKFSHGLVDSFVDSISQISLRADRTIFLDDLPDPKDRVFYEVSLTADSYLVTGNIKHFPCAEKVVTPAELMNIIAEIKR